MEITCYFQCQHPSCSPPHPEPDWGPPCPPWPPSCHSVSQTCVWGNRDVVGLKNAMGSRLSPLSSLDGTKPVTNKSRVVMIKHILPLPRHRHPRA